VFAKTHSYNLVLTGGIKGSESVELKRRLLKKMLTEDHWKEDKETFASLLLSLQLQLLDWKAVLIH